MDGTVGVTLATGAGETSMRAMARTPCDSAQTRTSPGDRADTTPSCETTAIASSALAQCTAVCTCSWRLSSGVATSCTRSPARNTPGGSDTLIVATRLGTIVSRTSLCTPPTVAVICTSPALTACTVPRVSSIVAIWSLLDDQRRRTPGTVSPDGFRGEPLSVNVSPTSTMLGGAKISTAATYGLTSPAGCAPEPGSGVVIAPGRKTSS